MSSRAAPCVRAAARCTLFNLKSDPGQKGDIKGEHPDIVASLDRAYAAWWAQSVPLMENEQAYQTAPKVNPYRAAYFARKGAG